MNYTKKNFDAMYEALKSVLANEANQNIQGFKNSLFAYAPDIKFKVEQALLKAEGK